MAASVRMLIVDLRHWLDDTGRLAPQARLAPFMAAIVESATAAAGSGLSVVPCRKSTAKAACEGRIAVHRHEDSIEWACHSCRDSGVITGWQGSHWDLRDADIEDGVSDVVVFVPLAELAILRSLPMPASARSIMATPPTVTAGVAGVPLTHAEADKLRGLIELHLCDSKGREKLLCVRSLGRVEQALMFSEQTKAAAARRRHGEHVH